MRKYLLTAIALSTLVVACNRPTEQQPQAGEGQQPQATQTTTTPMEAGQTGAMQPNAMPQQPGTTTQPAMNQGGMMAQQPQAMQQQPAMSGTVQSPAGMPGVPGNAGGTAMTTTITTTTNPAPDTMNMPAVQQAQPQQGTAAPAPAPQQQTSMSGSTGGNTQAAVGNRPTHGTIASQGGSSATAGQAS